MQKTYQGVLQNILSPKPGEAPQSLVTLLQEKTNPYLLEAGQFAKENTMYAGTPENNFALKLRETVLSFLSSSNGDTELDGILKAFEPHNQAREHVLLQAKAIFSELTGAPTVSSEKVDENAEAIRREMQKTGTAIKALTEEIIKNNQGIDNLDNRQAFNERLTRHKELSAQLERFKGELEVLQSKLHQFARSEVRSVQLDKLEEAALRLKSEFTDLKNIVLEAERQVEIGSAQFTIQWLRLTTRKDFQPIIEKLEQMIREEGALSPESIKDLESEAQKALDDFLAAYRELKENLKDGTKYPYIATPNPTVTHFIKLLEDEVTAEFNKISEYIQSIKERLGVPVGQKPEGAKALQATLKGEAPKVPAEAASVPVLINRVKASLVLLVGAGIATGIIAALLKGERMEKKASEAQQVLPAAKKLEEAKKETLKPEIAAQKKEESVPAVIPKEAPKVPAGAEKIDASKFRPRTKEEMAEIKRVWKDESKIPAAESLTPKTVKKLSDDQLRWLIQDLSLRFGRRSIREPFEIKHVAYSSLSALQKKEYDLIRPALEDVLKHPGMNLYAVLKDEKGNPLTDKEGQPIFDNRYFTPLDWYSYFFRPFFVLTQIRDQDAKIFLEALNKELIDEYGYFVARNNIASDTLSLPHLQQVVDALVSHPRRHEFWRREEALSKGTVSLRRRLGVVMARGTEGPLDFLSEHYGQKDLSNPFGPAFPKLKGGPRVRDILERAAELNEKTGISTEHKVVNDNYGEAYRNFLAGRRVVEMTYGWKNESARYVEGGDGIYYRLPRNEDLLLSPVVSSMDAENRIFSAHIEPNVPPDQIFLQAIRNGYIDEYIERIKRGDKWLYTRTLVEKDGKIVPYVSEEDRIKVFAPYLFPYNYDAVNIKNQLMSVAWHPNQKIENSAYNGTFLKFDQELKDLRKQVNDFDAEEFQIPTPGQNYYRHFESFSGGISNLWSILEGKIDIKKDKSQRYANGREKLEDFELFRHWANAKYNPSHWKERDRDKGFRTVAEGKDKLIIDLNYEGLFSEWLRELLELEYRKIMVLLPLDTRTYIHPNATSMQKNQFGVDVLPGSTILNYKNQNGANELPNIPTHGYRFVYLNPEFGGQTKTLNTWSIEEGYAETYVARFRNQLSNRNLLPEPLDPNLVSSRGALPVIVAPEITREFQAFFGRTIGRLLEKDFRWNNKEGFTRLAKTGLPLPNLTYDRDFVKPGISPEYMIRNLESQLVGPRENLRRELIKAMGGALPFELREAKASELIFPLDDRDQLYKLILKRTPLEFIDQYIPTYGKKMHEQHVERFVNTFLTTGLLHPAVLWENPNAENPNEIFGAGSSRMQKFRKLGEDFDTLHQAKVFQKLYRPRFGSFLIDDFLQRLLDKRIGDRVVVSQTGYVVKGSAYVNQLEREIEKHLNDFPYDVRESLRWVLEKKPAPLTHESTTAQAVENLYYQTLLFHVAVDAMMQVYLPNVLSEISDAYAAGITDTSEMLRYFDSKEVVMELFSGFYGRSPNVLSDPTGKDSGRVSALVDRFRKDRVFPLVLELASRQAVQNRASRIVELFTGSKIKLDTENDAQAFVLQAVADTVMDLDRWEAFLKEPGQIKEIINSAARARQIFTGQAPFTAKDLLEFKEEDNRWGYVLAETDAALKSRMSPAAWSRLNSRILDVLEGKEKEIPLDGIVRGANELRQALGAAMGTQYLVLVPGDLRKFDEESQGWIRSFVKTGIEQGWKNWTGVKQDGAAYQMNKYLRGYVNSPQQRADDLKEAAALYQSALREKAMREFHPENSTEALIQHVLNDSEIQGFFLGWVQRQVKSRSEARADILRDTLSRKLSDQQTFENEIAAQETEFIKKFTAAFRALIGKLQGPDQMKSLQQQWIEKFAPLVGSALYRQITNQIGGDAKEFLKRLETAISRLPSPSITKKAQLGMEQLGIGLGANTTSIVPARVNPSVEYLESRLTPSVVVQVDIVQSILSLTDVHPGSGMAAIRNALLDENEQASKTAGLVQNLLPHFYPDTHGVMGFHSAPIDFTQQAQAASQLEATFNFLKDENNSEAVALGQFFSRASNREAFLIENLEVPVPASGLLKLKEQTPTFRPISEIEQVLNFLSSSDERAGKLKAWIMDSRPDSQVRFPSELFEKVPEKKISAPAGVSSGGILEDLLKGAAGGAGGAAGGGGGLAAGGAGVNAGIGGGNSVIVTPGSVFEETPESEALRQTATIRDSRENREGGVAQRIQFLSIQTSEGGRRFELQLVRRIGANEEVIPVSDFRVAESFPGGAFDQLAVVRFGANLYVFTFRGDNGQTWVVVYNNQTGTVSTVTGQGEIPIQAGMDAQNRPVLNIGNTSFPLEMRAPEPQEEEAREVPRGLWEAGAGQEIISSLIALGVAGVNPAASEFIEFLNKGWGPKEDQKNPEKRSEVRMIGETLTRREALQGMIGGVVSALTAGSVSGRALQPAAQPADPAKIEALDRGENVKRVTEFNDAMREASKRLGFSLSPRDLVQFNDNLDAQYRRGMLISGGRRLTRDVIAHETTTRVDLRPLVQKFVATIGVAAEGDHAFTVDDWIENFFLPLFRMFGIPTGTPQKTSRQEASFIERFTDYARELKPWIQDLKIRNDGEVSRFWRGDFMSVLGGRIRDDKGNISRASDTDLWVILNEAWPPAHRIPHVDLGTFLGTVLFFTMIAESRRWIPPAWQRPVREGEGYWDEANLKRFFVLSLNNNPRLQANSMEISRFHDTFGEQYFNIFFYPLPNDEIRFLQTLLTQEFAGMLRFVYPNLRVAPADELVGPRTLAAASLIPTLAALQSTDLWPQGASIRYFLSGDQRAERASRQAFREMMQKVARTLIGIRQDVENFYEGYDPKLVDEIFQKWLAGEYRIQPGRRAMQVWTRDILQIDPTRMPEDFAFLRAVAGHLQNAAPADSDLQRITGQAVMDVVGMRFGKLLNWGLYGLKRGLVQFQDRQGQIPQTNVTSLSRMIREMRQLLFVAQQLIHRGERRFNLNGNTDSGILAGMRNNMAKSELFIEAFKFLLALSYSSDIQQGALQLLHAITGNPLWAPEERPDLRNSLMMGSFNGWSRTRYLEGMHQTRDKANLIASLFNDRQQHIEIRGEKKIAYLKRDKMFEFSNRLRRVWNPRAQVFTQEQLRTAPPVSDDIFGYLISEASAFQQSRLSWDEWIDLRERTIARLEQGVTAKVNPIRDAFSVLQALRRRPIEGAQFEKEFESFSRDLADRPQDQGWVISWVQNLVERQIRVDRPWGQEVARALGETDLKQIFLSASRYRQSLYQSMGFRAPADIQSANLTELDTQTQGWVMAYIQSAMDQIRTGGWEGWFRTVDAMRGFLDRLGRDQKHRDEVLKEVSALYQNTFRRPLVFTPELIINNRHAQGFFTAWVQRQQRGRSEVRAKEAVTRKELLEREAGLKEGVTRRGFLGRALAGIGAIIASLIFPNRAKANMSSRTQPRERLGDPNILQNLLPEAEVGQKSHPLIFGLQEPVIAALAQPVQPPVPIDFQFRPWSRELTEIMRIDSSRRELIDDAFLIWLSLQRMPPNLTTEAAIRQALASPARQQFEQNLSQARIVGMVFGWGEARLEQGWERTQGHAHRVAMVLTHPERRQEVLREAQQLADFQTEGVQGVPRILVADTLEESSVSQGFVIGWTQFRTTLQSENIEASWSETQGLVNEMITTLRNLGNPQTPEAFEWSSTFFRTIGELSFLSSNRPNPGEDVEDFYRRARQVGESAAAQRLNFFRGRGNEIRWQFLSGYSMALTADIRRGLGESIEQISNEEKFARHSSNYLHMLRTFHGRLRNYYQGLSPTNQPLPPDALNPLVADAGEKRRIWGEYAVRLRMIEEVQGRYGLTPDEVTKTMDDLIAVQQAAREAQPGPNENKRPLEDDAVYYYYRLFYTTSVRQEIMRREAGQEAQLIPYARMQGNLSVREFFDLVYFVSGIRETAADGNDGIVAELERWERNPRTRPFWMTEDDIKNMKKFILGSRQEGIVGLRNEPLTFGEAIQAVTFYLDDLLDSDEPRWPGLRGAQSEILSIARYEMFLQSAYLLHHLTENGVPRRLDLADLSSWVTIIRQERFTDIAGGNKLERERMTRDRVAGFIRDDGFFEKLEGELRRKIIQRFGAEKASQFPIFDPWRRLGFVNRLGFIMQVHKRIHEMGRNGIAEKSEEWLKEWFEDIYLIQVSQFENNQIFVDPTLASYSVDSFRDGQRRVTSRVGRRLATTAREDLSYMNLGPEGNRLRRFLQVWKNIYKRMPTDEEIKWGLEFWDIYGNMPLARERKSGELERDEREAVARLQGAEVTFIGSFAEQMYAAIREKGQNTSIMEILSQRPSSAKLAETIARIVAQPGFPAVLQPFVGLSSLENKSILEIFRDLVARPIAGLMDYIPVRESEKENIRIRKEEESRVLQQRPEEGVPSIREALNNGRNRRARGEEGARETDAVLSQRLQSAYQNYFGRLREDQRAVLPSRIYPDKMEAYIKAIRQRGYTVDDVILRYVNLVNRITEVYRNVYEVRGFLSMRQQHFISALAERIFSDWGITDLQDKERVEARLRDARQRRQDLGVLFPVSVDDAIQKEIERLGHRMFDNQGRERWEGVLPMARGIRSALAKINRNVSEAKSYEMADNSTNAAVTLGDIEKWVDLSIALLGLINNIQVNGRFMRINQENALYLADLWLKIGLARLPRKPVIRANVTLETTRHELARIGITDEETIRLIADRMVARRVPAFQIKLLVDDALTIRRMRDEALERYRSRSRISDRFIAPRGLSDILQRLTPLDFLVLMDLYAHPDLVIGMIDIPELRYNRSDFEERTIRPINAMFKNDVDDLLRERIPEEIWQANWSWFEKLRYDWFKNYGIGNIHLALGISTVATVVIETARSIYLSWIKRQRREPPPLKVGTPRPGTRMWSHWVSKIFKENLKEKPPIEKEEVKTPGSFIAFKWASTFLTVLYTSLIMLTLNYSFFSILAVGLLAGTTMYLIHPIPTFYALMLGLWAYAKFPKTTFMVVLLGEAALYLVNPFLPFVLIPLTVASFLKFRPELNAPEDPDANIADETPDPNIHPDHMMQLIGLAPVRKDNENDRKVLDTVLEDAVKILGEKDDPNLIYTFIVQFGPGKGSDEAEQKHRRDYTISRLNHFIETKVADEMKESVRKRMYLMIRYSGIPKPEISYNAGSYRWLYEAGPLIDPFRPAADQLVKYAEYTQATPRTNVDEYKRMSGTPTPVGFETANYANPLTEIYNPYVDLTGQKPSGAYRYLPDMREKTVQNHQRWMVPLENKGKEIRKEIEEIVKEIDALNAVSERLKQGGKSDQEIANLLGAKQQTIGARKQALKEAIATLTRESKELMRKLKSGDIRIGPIRYSQIMDAGITTTHKDLATLVRAMAGGTAVGYQARIKYRGPFITPYSLILKSFPQEILWPTQEAMQIAHKRIRSFGKQAFKNDLFYMMIVRPWVDDYSNMLRKKYTVPGFKTAPSSEDEFVAGELESEDEGVKLVPQANLFEDPMYNFIHEYNRMKTKWTATFDVGSIMVSRVLPSIKDHPYFSSFIFGTGVALFLSNVALPLMGALAASFSAVLALPLIQLGMIAFSVAASLIFFMAVSKKFNDLEKTTDQDKRVDWSTMANQVGRWGAWVLMQIKDHPKRTALVLGVAVPLIMMNAILPLLGFLLPLFPSPLVWGTAHFLTLVTTVGATGFLFLKVSSRLRELEAEGKIDFSELGPSARFQNNVVIRGNISELVWSAQLYITFTAMLSPGLIEVIMSFLGEILFLNIMLLLTHPKVLMALYIIINDMAKRTNQDFEALKKWTESKNLKPWQKWAVLGAGATGLVLEYLSRGLLEFVKSTSMYLVFIVLKPLVFGISFLRYSVSILYGIDMIQDSTKLSPGKITELTEKEGQTRLQIETASQSINQINTLLEAALEEASRNPSQENLDRVWSLQQQISDSQKTLVALQDQLKSIRDQLIPRGAMFDKFLKTAYILLEWSKSVKEPKPSEMSWVVAGITEQNFPFFYHLWTMKLPFSLGLSTALLILYPYLGPVIFNLSVVGTLIVGAVVAGMMLYGWRGQFLPDKEGGEPHDEYVTTGNMIEAIVAAGILVGVLVNLSFLSSYLPIDLIKRASPIFITSFLFAPAISWLAGINFKAIVTVMKSSAGLSTEEIDSKAEAATRMASIGFAIAALVGALVFSVPPLSEMMGNMLGVIMPQVPSGDGVFTTPAVLLDFSESLRLPWYFALFFNIIVGGGVVLGIGSFVAGAITNFYQWWKGSRGRGTQTSGPQAPTPPPNANEPVQRSEVRAEESPKKGGWKKILLIVGSSLIAGAAAILIGQALLKKGEEEKKPEPPALKKSLPETVFRGGNWQVIGNFDKGPSPVAIHKNYTQLEVYFGTHQAFVITGSGYIRPVTRGRTWGPSVMTPGAWINDTYDHNMTIQNAAMSYNDAGKSLTILGELRDRRGFMKSREFSITFRLPPDTSKKVEAELHYSIIAQQAFQFDQNRLKYNGPFRPAQIVSMFQKSGFDSNRATVISGDAKLLIRENFSRWDAFVFEKPPQLTRNSTLYLENTEEGARNTPTVYLTPMNVDLSQSAFQIWIAKSNGDLTHDNVGAWLQYVNPLNPEMKFAAGQEIGTFDFIVGAKSDPRSETRSGEIYEKFVSPELTLKAHTEGLNPIEEKSVHEQVIAGINTFHRDLMAKNELDWLGQLINRSDRSFGEILDGFKNFFQSHGYPDELIQIRGAAWKIGPDQFATFGQHRNAIFEAARALASGNTAGLLKRFEPGVSQQAAEEGIGKIKEMFDALSDREKMLLEISIAVHDIGRYVSTGPRHPTIGGHIVPGFLEDLKNKSLLTAAEVDLISALTSRELEYGSLQWGETTPFKLLEGLQEQGVEPKVFLSMLSILAGFLDPGSVPRGSLDQMGKLTSIHTDNAVFLSQPENIERLKNVWAVRRWTGLRLPERNSLPLTTLDQDASSIPAQLLKSFGEQNPEFSNHMTIQRMVLALREFDDQSLVNFLHLLKGLYDSQKIDFVGFSTDRWEEESGKPVVEAFYRILSSIPSPHDFIQRGGHFELYQDKNVILIRDGVRDGNKIYGFGTFVQYPEDKELVLNMDSWQSAVPAAGEGQKRAEVREVQQRLFEALESAQGIKQANLTEQQKGTYLGMVRDVDETRIAPALHQAIEKLGITTKATANLPGELVINFEGVKDYAALTRILMDLRLRTQVKVFIFNSASASDWGRMNERFARQVAEAGNRVELVDRTKFVSVAQFVRARARDRQMTDERAIIQIMTQPILHSPKEANLILNTWIAALSEAEGKRTIVVVGARQRIGKASMVTLMDILRESFEAMQAVKSSA